MRYRVLATDYDGTLASQGTVAAPVLAALDRFRRSGRTLVLVTGRELDELLGIFPGIDVFDRVVAENGGLLYCPRTGKQHVLGEPPSSSFVQRLIDRGVSPVSVGRSIVATFTPHETVVLETIRDLGLELQVIFNKGAVMVLPAGVNKATGLAAALDDLHLSMRNVVAIGDAENDHAMLRAAEFGIAVGNALPTLKQEADHVSGLSHGDAVVEAMKAMLDDDLATLSAGRPPRRALRLGTLADGAPLSLDEANPAVWLTGEVEARVTQYLVTLLEQLSGDGYQACILDYDGSLARVRGVLRLGSSTRLPTVEEVVTALSDAPRGCVAVDIAGHDVGACAAFVASLWQACLRLRAATGRPHWWVCANVPESTWHDLFSLAGREDVPGIIGSGIHQGGPDGHAMIRLDACAAGAPGRNASRGADTSSVTGAQGATFWSGRFVDGIAFRLRTADPDI